MLCQVASILLVQLRTVKCLKQIDGRSTRIPDPGSGEGVFDRLLEHRFKPSPSGRTFPCVLYVMHISYYILHFYARLDGDEPKAPRTELFLLCFRECSIIGIMCRSFLLFCNDGDSKEIGRSRILTTSGWMSEWRRVFPRHLPASRCTFRYNLTYGRLVRRRR